MMVRRKILASIVLGCNRRAGEHTVGHSEKKDMNSYHQSFQIKKDVLHVHLSGKFPDELLRSPKNLFQPLIDACSTYNCQKALIDVRDLELQFDTLALFRSGEDAAFLTYIGIRIALLAREDMLNPFFDNVAYNRGGRVGVFTKIDSAQEWLQK